MGRKAPPPVPDGGTESSGSERSSREVLQSVELTLSVELRDDEAGAYAARVNDGPRFVDCTALEAIRRALWHSPDYSIPAPDQNIRELLTDREHEPVPDGGTESSGSECLVLCHYYDEDGLCGDEAQDLVRGKTGSPRGAQAKRLLSARIPVCQSHGEYLTNESGIRYEFIGRFLDAEDLQERIVLPDDWPRHDCSLHTDSDHEPVPDGGTESSDRERDQIPQVCQLCLRENHVNEDLVEAVSRALAEVDVALDIARGDDDSSEWEDPP